MDNEISVTREEEGGIRDYLSLGIMLGEWVRFGLLGKIRNQ
jgi:hypothetical protein